MQGQDDNRTQFTNTTGSMTNTIAYTGGANTAIIVTIGKNVSGAPTPMFLRGGRQVGFTSHPAQRYRKPKHLQQHNQRQLQGRGETIANAIRCVTGTTVRRNQIDFRGGDLQVLFLQELRTANGT